jgi:hypothetical protein
LQKTNCMDKFDNKALINYKKKKFKVYKKIVNLNCIKFLFKFRLFFNTRDLDDFDFCHSMIVVMKIAIIIYA